MGEPARNLDLTSSLSPKQPQPVRGDESSDASKVVHMRNTPVVEVMREDEIFNMSSEKIKEEIERTRAKLFWLLKMQKLVEEDIEESDKNKKKTFAEMRKEELERLGNLIKVCSDDFSHRMDQSLSMVEIKNIQDIKDIEDRKNSYVDNPNKLIKVLDICKDSDQNMISAILFIFDISGTDLDLESMDFEKMNPKNNQDRETLKRLSVFLNSRIRDAIQLVNNTLADDKKGIIRQRIRLIEKTLDKIILSRRTEEKAA